MQKNTTVELLNKAIEIAVAAHKNQTDKDLARMNKYLKAYKLLTESLQ